MYKQKLTNKILLVDDDAKSIQVAMSILKDYNIIYAQSGQKALELVEHNQFDLILLDVVMPNMDGIEVCKTLKSNKLTKEIPIIFLTLKDEEKDIVKGFEVGAVDYITKPFYPSVLLKRVESHLLLSKTLNNLKGVVSEQVEQIREKDKVLNEQQKIKIMTDMIDSISLHWKRPLGMIKLYMQSIEYQTLQDNVDAKEVKNVALKAIDEVESLNKTIDDFKDFFKHDNTKEDVNIKVMIDSILLLSKDFLIKDNILPTVTGDISLSININLNEFRHVLMNLLNNSLDTFRNKSIENKFIEFSFSDESDYCKLIYKDNAAGLDEDTFNSVFNPNFTFTNERIGAGLYLSKFIVENFNGEIRAKNLDDGVQFELLLPKNSI